MGYGYVNLFEETVSAVTATNSVGLGQTRHYNGVDYVYAYNAGNSQINPGYGVIASANSGYSCTLSSAIGDRCFGVVHNATATTGTYFWLAQQGFVHIQASDTASAAVQGARFFMDANGTFRHAATGATGSTWAFNAVATAVEAISTAGTGAVYLNV